MTFVCGLFASRAAAAAALRRLAAVGFRRDDVSVLATADVRERAALDYVFDALAPIGPLAVHGTGPMADALRAAPEHGARTLAEALVELGIPAHEARYADDRVASGGILVGVHAEGARRDRARGVLLGHGATGARSVESRRS